MIVIESAAEMRAWSHACKKEGKTIGFIPTMGALHEGHLSLMREAARHNDAVVVSIFVNPAQFGPTEDFDTYPRTFEADKAKCETCGVHAIYAPRASAMYPQGYATYVNVERINERLCGKSRPHFFRGVATVVTKLFNAVLPDRAYFGQKDAQQCAVIRRMVRDLDFGIEIVELPTVREADGLAMSSRNAYLSGEDRAKAIALSKALEAAKDLVISGERDPMRIIAAVRNRLDTMDIDYVELVDAQEITPVEKIEGNVLLAVAAWVGGTRLIDNIKFEVPKQ